MMTGRLVFVIFLVMAVSSPGGRAGPLAVGSTFELEAQRQRLAGIRSEAVERRSFSPKIPVPAQVIDPVPLIEAGNRLTQLARERAGQEKIAAILHERIARLERISQLSRRDPLEQARWEWLTAKTRGETLQLEAAHLEDRLVAEWGPVLAEWAKAGTEQLGKLTRGEIFLLRLILPQGDRTRTAVLEHDGTLFPLQYLCPTPKTDPVFSGSPHFFLTATSSDLRIGERLTAWLTEAGEAIPIPAQAVVWHGGMAWIFVQTGLERFERRRLTEWHETEEIFWVQAGLEPGERVVTRGAQLLLAEELKAQVPDEDDAD